MVAAGLADESAFAVEKKGGGYGIQAVSAAELALKVQQYREIHIECVFEFPDSIGGLHQIDSQYLQSLVLEFLVQFDKRRHLAATIATPGGPEDNQDQPAVLPVALRNPAGEIGQHNRNHFLSAPRCVDTHFCEEPGRGAYALSGKGEQRRKGCSQQKGADPPRFEVVWVHFTRALLIENTSCRTPRCFKFEACRSLGRDDDFRLYRPQVLVPYLDGIGPCREFGQRREA